jgi:hypothetical protein
MNWKTALGWWVVAGALGVLLRYQLLYPVPALTYPFLLHAHSHVVLLGWAFNALFLALTTVFVPPGWLAGHRWIWVGFQVAVLGMLVFFPLQGYATGSIVFSTLHVFVSYAMAWKLWRAIRSDQSLSASLVRWALFFLVLSTLGPYAVGMLKAQHLQDTFWYPLAIYFYLHFLYNGWFMFGCLALVFRWLEGWGLLSVRSVGDRFITLFAVSCLGTWGLSALWIDPPRWVWWLAGASALVQAMAGAWLIGWLWQQSGALRRRLRPNVRWLLGITLVSFCVKLTLQLLSATPWAAEWAYGQRHLVIAYLHLVFIGVVSFYLLAWALQQRQIRWTAAGMGTLVIGFILTESGLVAESVLQRFGRFLPYFGEAMLVVSAGLWFGVLLVWLRQLKRSQA